MLPILNEILHFFVTYGAGIMFGVAWRARWEQPGKVILVKHRLWQKCEEIAVGLSNTARFVGVTADGEPFTIEKRGTVTTDHGTMTVIVQRTTGDVTQ